MANITMRNNCPVSCVSASSVTAMCKTRIRFTNKQPIVGVLEATVDKSLELSSQGKLVSRFDLPFGDCCKLLHLSSASIKCNRNFCVALSLSSCAAVLDLESGTIIRTWENIENIEIRDELILGFPQLILTTKGIGSRRLIVTPENDWEPQCTLSQSEACEAPAVCSVVTALENQLKSACSELQSKQNQLLLRKSLVNRALSSLSRAVTLEPCKSRPPTYTMPINKVEQDLKSPPELTDEGCLPIKTSDLWQVVDFPTCSWVIGLALQATSKCTLSNIRCVLVTKNNETAYEMTYYVEKKDGKAPKFYSRMAKLHPDERLFITGAASIPDFRAEEVEEVNVFLTCNLSTHPEKLFQCSLGSCTLSFRELGEENLHFNHLVNKQPLPHEQTFGLLSILKFEERYALEAPARGSLPPKRIHEIFEKLQLLYDPSSRCYYGSSFYGHVAMLVLSEAEGRAEIAIRTHRSGDMRMFIRHLKNNLDRATLTLLPPSTRADASPHELLTAGLDLLSIGKLEDDDEPMEVSGKHSDNQIDRIRSAFLRKQKALTNTNRGDGSHFAIPSDAYSNWQDSYFEK